MTWQKLHFSVSEYTKGRLAGQRKNHSAVLRSGVWWGRATWSIWYGPRSSEICLQEGL